MERVQRRLTGRAAASRGPLLWRAAAAASLAAALALAGCNTTDTSVRVGGALVMTYAVTSTSGIVEAD